MRSGKTMRKAVVLAALVTGPALAAAGGATASGPGFLCDGVTTTLSPVQTGALTAGEPSHFYEDPQAVPGETYAVVAASGHVQMTVWTHRYLGWGWKCFGVECQMDTLTAAAGATSCTAQGFGKRHIQLALLDTMAEGATYALASSTLPVPVPVPVAEA